MRSAERSFPRRTALQPARTVAGVASVLLASLAVLAALAPLAGCDTIGMRFRSAAPDDAATATTGTPAAPQAAPAPALAGSAPIVWAAPIAPDVQHAYDNALAELRANHLAEAERGLRALAQSDPDLAGPHANLGLIARRAGRLPEAIAELERATRLDPQQPVMWNQLGIAYRQHGDFAKAREAYEHAIALDPGYATAVLNLGVLEDLYLNDGAQALALYTRYLALTPAGDATVVKWVADLKNRRPAAASAASTPASASAPGSAPVTASTPEPATAPSNKEKKS